MKNLFSPKKIFFFLRREELLFCNLTKCINSINLVQCYNITIIMSTIYIKFYCLNSAFVILEYIF